MTEVVGRGGRGAPRPGGTLREGFDYDFSRCDPTGAHVDPAWCAVYETATVAGPDGELVGWKTCDGTGPFRFVESVPGSHFDVARWDGYGGAKTRWEANRGPAHLDGIRWIPILDDRDRATALEDGDVDCIQNASLLDVEGLTANPHLEVIEFQQSALVYLGLDHGASSLG